MGCGLRRLAVGVWGSVIVTWMADSPLPTVKFWSALSWISS
jgi:hypothetical protein